MKYNQFIKNSPKVSEIGLGAWQLGHNSGWKSMSEKEAIEIVTHALDAGINFFDTSPNYGLGTSEERLGKALKAVDRDKIVINTKFGHTADGLMNFSSNQIRASLEGSLRRLQVDYVDSLILHNSPREHLDGNKTDHYEIFEQLIDEGKIKAYGASLDTYEDIQLLINTTNSTVVEAFFNILHQDTSQAFELAVKKGVAIIVKIPLDSGWLSGKYNAENSFNDIRSRWSKEDSKTRARLVQRVKAILDAENDLAQKAIMFCASYAAVATVIPGNSSIAQLSQNVASTQHPVSKKLVTELEEFYQNEVKELHLPW